MGEYGKCGKGSRGRGSRVMEVRSGEGPRKEVRDERRSRGSEEEIVEEVR